MLVFMLYTCKLVVHNNTLLKRISYPDPICLLKGCFNVSHLSLNLERPET